MKKGDLIKHFIFYAEGDIVKNAEYGIIVELLPKLKILKDSGEICDAWVRDIEVIK